MLPVATGYLMDAVGLAWGSILFALVLVVTASVGGIWGMRQSSD
ncbi:MULTISPECIES: hypothetical protein [Rahnella]|nr:MULTISPECIES: hypothetical protein [Rahnella]